MKPIFDFYQGLSDRRKLLLILSFALIIRIIAAIYSAGYAMHDDHFLVVETPSSWAYGFDSGSWFPEKQQQDIANGLRQDIGPQGHSLFYPSLQYSFFEGVKFLGIENPKVVMLINRILHGLLGVLVVYLVFNLTNLLSNSRTAFSAAWVAALAWALPFLSVRNLVEIVAIPFLLGAVIFTLRSFKTNSNSYGFIAGLLMALAVSARYQTIVFFGVFGVFILFQKKWKPALVIFSGFILMFFLVQGVPDWLIWGYPFAEMKQYFGYNLSDARLDYVHDLGFNTFGLNYLAVLAMITVPILGAFWLFGFFTQWKKIHLLFWPCLAFLLVHMSYENIQERFIFPILHLVLIVGLIGWHEFQEKSQFWMKNRVLWTRISIVSWSINFVLLFFLSTYYGKKSRVEAAYALYENRSIDFVIHENSADGNIPLLPLFYAHNWNMKFYEVNHNEDFQRVIYIENQFVAWLCFHGDEHLEERIEQAKVHFPAMKYVATFEPSFLDKVIKQLNPVNRNETLVVYEVSVD